MKNHKAFFVLQYILVLGLSRNAYAQRGNYNYKSARRNNKDYPSGIAISLGANHFFTDKTNLNAWANNEYQKSVLQSPVGFNLDMTFIGNHIDGGFHLQANNPYALSTLFVGTRLYHSPRFCSFLNAEVGIFEAEVDNIVPRNYVPTKADQGHSMFLEYEKGCIGLSLKNMFVSKPNKNGTSFISSIDVQFAYMPWQGAWEYGYQSGKYFHGTAISGIPQLSNMCFSVTYSIGVLICNDPHNR